jgi:peptidoglycan/xylan/chitin deacetylase (PgdA/CDA1 family)
MWGMRDKHSIETYGDRIKGVHQVIPRLLETFNKHNICATFATVGFVFFKDTKELSEYLPAKKPRYANKNLSPYQYIDAIGADLSQEIYHYGASLVAKIQEYPEHEIGTHTFSHYYCLEEGQTIEDFEDDLKSAIKIARTRGINISALVFPRNQFNKEYVAVCKKLGIICYRGNQFSWMHAAKNDKDESVFRRAARLIDAYFNISGFNCYSRDYLRSNFPIDIPASRFLRPYSKKLRFLDIARLKRIKSEMTYAAKKGLVYHLWWHPHNFGVNQNENFAFLEKILTHYSALNEKFNFRSCTMSALAKETIGE